MKMGRFYRFAKILLTAFVRVFFRLKVYGFENIPKDSGLIVCCNHTSMTDVFLLIALYPKQISFMAKQELFKNKIFATVLGWMTAFPVNREKGDSSAIKRAEEIVSSGGILGIFPEGTRNPEGRPGRAKAGTAFIAAATKSDILPCSIYREGKVKPFQKATVRFGEVIPFEKMAVAADGAGRSAVSETTKQIMGVITELWEMGQ